MAGPYKHVAGVVTERRQKVVRPVEVDLVAVEVTHRVVVSEVRTRALAVERSTAEVIACGIPAYTRVCERLIVPRAPTGGMAQTARVWVANQADPEFDFELGRSA